MSVDVVLHVRPNELTDELYTELYKTRLWSERLDKAIEAKDPIEEELATNEYPETNWDLLDRAHLLLEKSMQWVLSDDYTGFEYDEDANPIQLMAHLCDRRIVDEKLIMETAALEVEYPNCAPIHGTTRFLGTCKGKQIITMWW